MLKIHHVITLEKLEKLVERGALEMFIHNEMKPYHDSISAISKSLDYAFSTDKGKGGYVLLSMENETLVGATVVNHSGMDEYIPGVFLVYVAVKESHRGQGIGALMIKKVIGNAEGQIALHVEYENPARRLYERMGFVSKYAEMRYDGDAKNGSSENPY